jgi:hypothetical protein
LAEYLQLADAMRAKYPSDISRDVFETKAQLVLERVRKKTKSRVVDLYEVFAAFSTC